MQLFVRGIQKFILIKIIEGESVISLCVGVWFVFCVLIFVFIFVSVIYFWGRCFCFCLFFVCLVGFFFFGLINFVLFVCLFVYFIFSSFSPTL